MASPFRFLSFTISIAADNTCLSAIPAPRLVSSTLCLSLSTGFACSAYVTAMKSSGRRECRLGTFSKTWNSHFLGT